MAGEGASGNAGSGGAGEAGASGAAAGASNAGGGGTGTSIPAPGVGAGQSNTGASGSTNTGAVIADWQSGFNDDTRGYIANKGWQKPEHMLESYRNLEKMVGASPDQVIRLPKVDDPQAAEAMNAIYDRLGRPKTGADYKLEIPKENGDAEFAKVAGEQFYKLGLSEKQGQDLVKWWNESQAGALKANQEALQMKVTQGKETLKRDWGAAYEQNMQLAKKAVQAFGVNGQTIDALESQVGYDGVMKFFHAIGIKIGGEPGTFHTGGTPPGNGAMTPAQAKARMAELQNDQGWVARYLSGDSAAKAEKDKLDHFIVAGKAS